MAHPSIVREQCEANLDRFEGILQELNGVTDEHLDALRAATNASSGSPTYPKPNDPVGIAAYQAAALAALAAAVLDAQNATA